MKHHIPAGTFFDDTCEDLPLFSLAVVPISEPAPVPGPPPTTDPSHRVGWCTRCGADLSHSQAVYTGLGDRYLCWDCISRLTRGASPKENYP